MVYMHPIIIPYLVVVDPSTLFRANSGGSKFMGSYARLVGTRYMRHTVQQFIKQIVADSSGFEVDPTKEPDLEKVKNNVLKLLETAQQMLNYILQSVDSVPLYVGEGNFVEMSLETLLFWKKFSYRSVGRSK